MCTPLLLQDKANLVEDYVAEYPELQRKLLQTLDKWCDPSFNIRDITRYKPEKFNRRVLSKLVFRLLERFNVDPGRGYCNILWSYLSNKEKSQFVFFHVHQGISAVIYPEEFQGLINDIEKQS
uniref:Uncharacterized protein n=1 Tax=Catharus ustulatus TaxID=91951 RepID=A0A8C3V9T4_CATUS